MGPIQATARILLTQATKVSNFLNYSEISVLKEVLAGPVMAYLSVSFRPDSDYSLLTQIDRICSAKVDNATSLSVTGLKWFKIWEDGMDSSQKWGVDRLIANKGKVSFTIPSCIAAGQYLLRVELIGTLSITQGSPPDL